MGEQGMMDRDLMSCRDKFRHSEEGQTASSNQWTPVFNTNTSPNSDLCTATISTNTCEPPV